MADCRFIDRDGREKNLDAGALLRRLSRGRISLETPVRSVGEAEFHPLKEDPDLGPAAGVIECENWTAARRFSLTSEIGFFLCGMIFAVSIFLFGAYWKLPAFLAVWTFPDTLMSAQFRKRWPCLPSRGLLRRAWLLLLPYLNLLTGPAAGFAMFRRRRFAFTVAWAAYTLLVVMLWLLPGVPQARFYPAILLLFAYGAAFWIQISVTRGARLRLEAVRRAAGFGEVPPWYRPLPRRSSPLLPFWPRRGKAEMRLFAWSLLVCFLSLGIYAGVLWAVGMIQLGEVEREVRERGLSVAAGQVSESERVAAALFDSIELPPFPGENEAESGRYPDLPEKYDMVYRRQVQRYFEANRERFRCLRGVWALGLITLPDAEPETVQERRRKIWILAKLFEPGLRQEYSSADLSRVLRFLYRLEALDEGFLCRGGSANLTGRCAASLSLESLYAEADFWRTREELLQRRFLDLFWRTHLERLDEEETLLGSAMIFYRPVYRAKRLRRMLAEIPRTVWEFGDGSSPGSGEFTTPNLFDPSTFSIDSVRMSRLYREALARCRAARAGIAAEIFRRTQGRFPETLEELVPKYLPAVFRDPFSGDGLRYLCGNLEYVVHDVRFRDGRFEKSLRKCTADGIRIYSLGADGVDDGGRNRGDGEISGDVSFTIVTGGASAD